MGRTQRVLSHVRRDEAIARDLGRDYATEHRADREAVPIVGPASGKKGRREPGLRSISARMKSAISSAA